MSDAQTLMTEAVTELVAIGAAMASNCEPCFRAHFDRARKAGVTVDDMRKAADVALSVKAAPHRKVIETAERYFASLSTEDASPCCAGKASSCC